mgnify:CR=1 FL=1
MYSQTTDGSDGCNPLMGKTDRENATSAARLECNLGPLRRVSLVLAEGHGRDNLGSAASSSFAQGYAAPTDGHCHLDSASGHGTATTTWIIDHATLLSTRLPWLSLPSVYVERIRCFATLTCLAKLIGDVHVDSLHWC